MTDHLRGALAEIAERAPVVEVSDDLWRSARRSAFRTVAAAGVAAAAVAASAVGLGTLLHHGASPGPPSTPTGDSSAVPSHVYVVPDRLTGTDDRGRPTGPLESDLSVGTSAVAYMTQSGIPVVVTAADGRYHLLDLPGFLGEAPHSFATLLGAGLSLSPDGGSLAYAYAGGYDAGGTPSATGIRILDLRSGTVRTIELPQVDQGVQVRQIVWSPDSRWLAWYGQIATSWTSDTAHFDGEVRGRIAPGAATSQPVRSPRDSATAMAVDDRGLVALLTTHRLLLAPVDGRVQVRRVHQPGSVTSADDPPRMSFDASGRRLALATSTPGRQTYTLTTTGRHVASRSLPDIGADGATVEPLGWLRAPDGPVSVSEVRPRSGDTILAGQIVLTRWGDGRPASTVVGRVDDLVNNPLSVAVDLMTVDRPTYDFAAPEWPLSQAQRVVVTCLVILGVLGLGWLAVLLVTRRRARG